MENFDRDLFGFFAWCANTMYEDDTIECHFIKKDGREYLEYCYINRFGEVVAYCIVPA